MRTPVANRDGAEALAPRSALRSDRGASNAPAIERLASELADQADTAELVAYFLSELRPHVTTMAQAWRQRDARSLRLVAHQLRGAADGYGYPSISAAATALDDGLATGDLQQSAVRQKFEALLALCRRALVDC